MEITGASTDPVDCFAAVRVVGAWRWEVGVERKRKEKGKRKKVAGVGGGDHFRYPHPPNWSSEGGDGAARVGESGIRMRRRAAGGDDDDDLLAVQSGFDSASPSAGWNQGDADSDLDSDLDSAFVLALASDRYNRWAARHAGLTSS